MDFTIDTVAFGNPCSRDIRIMKQTSFLDSLIEPLSTYTPPPNSSEVTKGELQQIENLLKNPIPDKDHYFDNQLLDAIKGHFIDHGAEEKFVTTVSDGIAQLVIPLLTKLKYRFNRPRPAQLAYYLEMKVYPEFSYFVNSPSYPSSHTCLTIVTCQVLGNLSPLAYKTIQPLIDSAADSRIQLGLHYKTDNDMSKVVAKKILDHPKFKEEFAL